MLFGYTGITIAKYIFQAFEVCCDKVKMCGEALKTIWSSSSLIACGEPADASVNANNTSVVIEAKNIPCVGTVRSALTDVFHMFW